jgi:hypothetical protein
LAVNLFAISCLTTRGDPAELAAKVRQQMVGGARSHTFPDLDPAMSDLFSAELEGAVDRLMATAQINVVLQARKKKTERGS